MRELVFCAKCGREIYKQRMQTNTIGDSTYALNEWYVYYDGDMPESQKIVACPKCDRVILPVAPKREVLV